MTGFLFIHGALLVFWLGATFATRRSYISVLPASLFVWHAMGLTTGLVPDLSAPGVLAMLAGPISVPFAVFLAVEEWPVVATIAVLASGFFAWLSVLRLGRAQSIRVRSLIWNFCFVVFGLIAYLVLDSVLGPFDALQLKGTL